MCAPQRPFYHAEGNIRSRRGSTHSAAKGNKAAHGPGGDHEDHHHHPRPHTITDIVTKLLESMASQRHTELTRRLYRHGT